MWKPSVARPYAHLFGAIDASSHATMFHFEPWKEEETCQNITRILLYCAVFLLRCVVLYCILCVQCRVLYMHRILM